MWLILATTALGADQSLLFVGNSYTAFNSLPDTVGLLLEEGAPTWDEVDRHALSPGGWTFSQHAGELLAGPNPHTDALIDGAFDFVILQEQSQMAGFDQSGGTWLASLQGASDLNDAIKGLDAQTMFYMTWGRRNGDNQNPDIYPDYITMQHLLTDGYVAYADELSTKNRPVFVAPAGLAFQAIWESEADPSDPMSLFSRLYVNDGSHPSPIGSMMVARVFYASLTGRSPVGLTTNPNGALTAEELEIVSATAHDVVLTDPWGDIRYPFALTWAEYAGDEVDVSIGGGAVRYQIRVEDDIGPARLTFGEGVLTLEADLQVGAMQADPTLSELVFDGGALVVTAEEPWRVDVFSATGSGRLEFTGLSSWSEADFPATVFTAETLSADLVVSVPAGFEATIDGSSVVITSDGSATAPDDAEKGCGCSSAGTSGWAWLLGALAIAGRRRPRRQRVPNRD